MTKFRLPKLNSWVTTLVLASIGLHGLVLALPMPDLIEEKPDVPEETEPEVIQVVTLPKLARTPGSSKPPLPEPPPEEPLPVEEPVDEMVLANPEILEELEEIEPELDDFSEWEEEPGFDEELLDEGDGGDEAPPELTLDERIASLDSYTDFDDTQIGNTPVLTQLGKMAEQGFLPTPLRDLERALSEVEVPLQECLENPPGTSVSFMVEVGPDGTLIHDPKPLNSSGYQVLDEKALEIARDADYAAYHAMGKTKAYSFNIEIDYEACNLASGLANAEAAS
ncbi:energy transducer TonB [Leptothoe sp. ISB3NOV94-8A]|uniref:TonB C-terminal domain-containing protein n=1 Tax=Adonisia turfae CCMR0081 TaxID=2292702 RepID=A0A6M0RUL8_9CYAN|nr:energy transducer TonB [Adonisia turfae]NEZ59432.1 hypothetical protein [Adonisia turfae CCMR0081]